MERNEKTLGQREIYELEKCLSVLICSIAKAKQEMSFCWILELIHRLRNIVHHSVDNFLPIYWKTSKKCDFN